MKLGIQPLLPIGNYLNKRYFIEMNFPDDSHPVENFKYLNETIMAIHMAEFPMFYKDGKPLFLPQSASYSGEEVQQTVAQMEEQVVQLDNKKPKSELQALLDGIESCTQIDGDGEFSLNTFWLRAKGNLVTSAAYKLKEKQLKDAK